MNRIAKRLLKKQADKRMKASNGHSYVTILKTRCQYCNRSPTQKGRCKAWFQTFIHNYKLILNEHGEIDDEDL